MKTEDHGKPPASIVLLIGFGAGNTKQRDATHCENDYVNKRSLMTKLTLRGINKKPINISKSYGVLEFNNHIIRIRTRNYNSRTLRAFPNSAHVARRVAGWMLISLSMPMLPFILRSPCECEWPPNFPSTVLDNSKPTGFCQIFSASGPNPKPSVN